MDNAIVHADNDDYDIEKDDNLESSREDCLSKKLVIEVKPKDVLISSGKNSQISDFCIQKLFLQHISGLNKRIPKQVMSLEEKYLRHCLELIHLSAMRANSWTAPSKINLLTDGFSSRFVSSRSSCDALILISSGVENVSVSTSTDPIIGSITGSTSLLNILNSPLIRQFGALDDDVNYKKTDASEVREPIPPAVMGNPGGLCLSSSLELQKERVVPEDQHFGSEPLHRRLVSFSSTNSTFSDPSSTSSSSSAYCQGMLHCSWNDGFPRYVFSLEDQREVYKTTLSKVESLNNKGLDYLYTFHSGSGKRENEIHDQDLDLVGTMRVSTSFTLCPHGTEIMETQFVSCATGDNSVSDTYTSNQTQRKYKGLQKKVVNIFRGSHSRQRTSSKFDGSFSIQESSLEPGQDRTISSPSNLPPNLELAAIVVRDYIHDSQMEAETGGWGLKFLKKGRNSQINTSPVALPVDCQFCRQNTGDCSTSMDVLVPAGFHGRPRTITGEGPSSLVDRWRSGGICDCGGWDVGCPLTLLYGRPNSKDVLHHAGVFGRSNSFDLFIQGSKQSPPAIKMVNIHDGLYYIHYQSTLSALQSLSISVAIIHSHSPTLRPKVYRN